MGNWLNCLVDDGRINFHGNSTYLGRPRKSKFIGISKSFILLFCGQPNKSPNFQFLHIAILLLTKQLIKFSISTNLYFSCFHIKLTKQPLTFKFQPSYFIFGCNDTNLLSSYRVATYSLSVLSNSIILVPL